LSASWIKVQTDATRTRILEPPNDLRFTCAAKRRQVEAQVGQQLLSSGVSSLFLWLKIANMMSAETYKRTVDKSLTKLRLKPTRKCTRISRITRSNTEKKKKPCSSVKSV